MNPPPPENVYLPKLATLDRVVEEIAGVKTFFWHFDDRAEQARFGRFRPGQFAQVSLFGVGEFPASLPPSPTEAETFFTIRQVGSCSAALHRLGPGDRFGVRGPYGRGFPMDEYRGKNLVFVAGGIGLIPLRSCIVYALEHRGQYGQIQIYYGAKSPAELLYGASLRDWQRSPGVACHLTVDRATDGWTGSVGVVGDLFRSPGARLPVDDTIAFVCGPPVMFRFVIRDLKALGFQDRNIVSTMERYMKCGVGKCGHCCIGVAYVCVDGPVFTYEQIHRLGEDI
jgi:NAD(P)H-flavin reductase